MALDYGLHYGMPPDMGDGDPRPLTEEELQAVLSGSGYTHRAPGGSSEVHGKMLPYNVRGYGRNNPGIFHAMVRRNPRIAGAVSRRLQALVGLDWDLTPPKSATPLELELTERMAEKYRDRIPAIAACQVTQSDVSGFALHELVWEMDDDGVIWADAVFMESWTVYRWVLNRSGFAMGVLLRNEDVFGMGGHDAMLEAVEPSFTFIPWEKLIHFAVGFTGRNYEGVSRLRSLYYMDEERRRRLIGQAITWERVGEGVLVIKMEDGAGDEDYADAAAIGRQWETGDRAYLVVPPYVEDITFEHGGSQIPDFSQFYTYVDHLISVVLDDATLELGQSASGARALGTEFRRSSDRSMEGLVTQVSDVLRHQFFAKIYEMNGWDARPPRIHVSGFEEPAKLRLILKALESGETPPLVKTPQDEDVLRRALGLGPAQGGDLFVAEIDEPDEPGNGQGMTDA